MPEGLCKGSAVPWDSAEYAGVFRSYKVDHFAQPLEWSRNLNRPASSLNTLRHDVQHLHLVRGVRSNRGLHLFDQ